MNTKVQTHLGWLEGERREGHVVFRGIAFAKPPLGQLRFRAPEPAEPWTGVRDARAFGPSSMQASSALMKVPAPFSEDCLYLNVYTPALDTARRPVFFWIHGGSFVLGAGSEPVYDGGQLAARGDIVVVTINYRLGALGFAHWSQEERARLGVRSNAGNLDQIAALRWVRSNIAAFGGDPDAVTIAGESAGAYSVANLLAMPEARGLFHRAIAQSGARLERGSGDPMRFSRALRRALEVSDEQLEVLWDVPAERVLAAQQAAAASETGGGAINTFSPVHDGDTLPLPLHEAIPSGETARVPLLIGTNRDEMNLFLGDALKKLNEPIAEPKLFEALAGLVPGTPEPRLRALLDVYRRSRSARDLPHSDRALLAAISTDALWRVPSFRFAEAHRAHQPATFQYLFTYPSPAMRGALGAFHGLELPFVFGTLDAPGQALLAGSGEPVQQLSERMMQAWIAFVRTGEPGWPAYDQVRRPTLVFDLQSTLEHAPYDDERAAWDELSPRPL
jgi:para-nitrobenzyl esterase